MIVEQPMIEMFIQILFAAVGFALVCVAFSHSNLFLFYRSAHHLRFNKKDATMPFFKRN